MLKNKTIVFLGSGQMAEAMIGGLLASRALAPARITACDVRPERLETLRKRYKIKSSASNRAAEKADVVVLSVKPQAMASLLDEVGGRITAKQLVVSIAAGVPLGFLEKFFKARVPVIRAMPNTPALVREGAVVIARGRSAEDGHAKLAQEIFSGLGLVLEGPESWMDAVTALSGSGPAYVFHLAELMCQAGEELGLPKDVAGALSRQTLYGAAKMLHERDESPEALRQKVTSPGGTTEAAFRVLNAKNFKNIFLSAVSQAKERSKSLAKEFSQTHSRRGAQ